MSRKPQPDSRWAEIWPKLAQFKGKMDEPSLGLNAGYS